MKRSSMLALSVALAFCLPAWAQGAAAAQAAAATASPQAPAAAADKREPYGIALEGYAYPHPVQLLPITWEGRSLRMAYMDVAPQQANGKTVLLLHGRNFPGSYWAGTIDALSRAGYRVVVPDQIHFGKSSARAEVFENKGHMLHLEAPDRFHSLVLNFLNQG